MKFISRAASLLLGASLVAASPAQAQISWNWSLGTEAGQFITSGSGNPSAGNYTLIDFIVQSSGAGATIGSMSGGQYTGSGLSTNLPYDFDWNGSAVTKWNSAGINTFDWWVFTQVSNTNKTYFFGWGQNNTNTVDQGTYYDYQTGVGQPSYKVTVGPSTTVPEPSSVVLLAIGATAIALVRRRRAV